MSVVADWKHYSFWSTENTVVIMAIKLNHMAAICKTIELAWPALVRYHTSTPRELLRMFSPRHIEEAC